ncbi:arylacetamide deacetylase [Calycina marina]|uniref:Arylacetamide deacetylase n=1 Tax=Calycina marina TaxID=1763456 RepID=A0A9P8CHU5_9HELO|nr:arylacetamide deacetylase [Calycina marina]
MGDEGFAQPWLDFEKEVGQRFLIKGPIEKCNEQFASFGAALMKHLTFPAGDSSVKTEDKEIATGLKIRIYTPPNYAGNKPAVLFYHGGGWAMGDLDGEDYETREVCRDTGLVIISVAYRLAPENPFPAGLNDCVTAYRWAIENSRLLNTVPNEGITFGTSAGGNLALSVALKLIDTGGAESLKGVATIAPVTVSRHDIPENLKARYTSYNENTKKSIDTEEGMKAFQDAYGGDGKDPYVSPLLHPRIKDLPKVYIVWASMDTLRDDSKLFIEAMNEAGVSNRADEYTGYPHWFWGYPSKHLVQLRKDYFSNMKKGFEFILS